MEGIEMIVDTGGNEPFDDLRDEVEVRNRSMAGQVVTRKRAFL